MAKDTSKDAPKSSASSTDVKSGTEVKTYTFTPSDDAVVPTDEEIVSVDHDRTMGVTRITTKRAYDAERSAEERAAREGPAATPTYPQPAGAVATPPAEPSTSYVWGTLDTTKVQNLEEVKRQGPTIAEQEAAGKPQEEKDATEVASEVQTAANEQSAEPAHTADQPVDTPSEDEAAAAAKSKASSDLARETAKG